MKEVDEIEKELNDLMDKLENDLEKDPQAHERLLELGEKISNRSDVGKKAVDEFLEERKSVY